MEINLSKEIQDRQKDIIKIEDNLTCVVIGVGGIGSWVAMDLALVGVKNLILVDPDRIEATNLNRTLFKLEDIGRLKVDALKSLIEERRNDITVITHDERFEEKMLKRYAKANFFFDCTDNLRTKDIVKESKPENYLKLGYDGFEGTFSLNDFKSGAWGEADGYTVTPSFFGSPQIISAMAVIELLINNNKTSETVALDVREVLSKFRVDRKKMAEESAAIIEKAKAALSGDTLMNQGVGAIDLTPAETPVLTLETDNV